MVRRVPLARKRTPFGFELQICGRRLLIVVVALLLQAILCAYATRRRARPRAVPRRCSRETLFGGAECLPTTRPERGRRQRSEITSESCTYKGWGVPQDDAIAASWFRKAAERGYPLAEAESGSHVPQWLGRAAGRYRSGEVVIGKPPSRATPQPS